MSRRVSMAAHNFVLTADQYMAAQAIIARDPAYFEEYGFDSGYGWDWHLAYDGTGRWTLSNDGEGTDEEADVQMFDRLAAVIPAGLYIAMFDEHGNHWRYYFDGTHCHLQEGTVVYDS